MGIQFDHQHFSIISLSFLPLTVSNSLYHFSTDSQTFLSIIPLYYFATIPHHSRPPTKPERRSLSLDHFSTHAQVANFLMHTKCRFRERAFVTLYKRVP